MRLHWQPVGPLPAALYWQRRAVVAGAVLLLLVLLVALLPGGDDDTLAAPAPSPRPSASPTPSVPPACPDDVLRLQADTAPADVPAGGGAQVRLAVTNTSTQPCSRDLGTGPTELIVRSGNDRVWSSDDCALAAQEVVVLGAGERRLITVAWDGRRSAPGCPTGGEVARPGTYSVLARVGSAQVQSPPFRVLP